MNLTAALDIQKTAERMLLAEYAPAGVIVDDALNIVHVRGDIGPYLHVAPGEPSFNLLKMTREGLIVSMRTAVLKARQKKSAVSQQGRVKNGGQLRDINLKVIPISGPGHAQHFMILFEEAAAGAPLPAEPAEQAAKSQKAGAVKGNGTRRDIVRLKRELAATREYLQSIIEEQEAASEELKSANEEAQASNEELETSKEELQSANEELNTVNDELKTRNFTLSEANNDLANVLTTIDLPLVIVGKDLRIRRFTQSMKPMLNLIDSDIGRSISDLKSNIDVPDLPELLRAVATGGRAAAIREVKGPSGRWFSLQAVPYRAPDNTISGALLLMLDIHAVRESRDFAEAIIKTLREPLLILNKDLTVRSANEAFYQTFASTRKETEGRFIWDLGNGQWNSPELRDALSKILPEKGSFEDFEIEHRFPAIGRRTMLLNAREIQQPTPDSGPAILLVIEDITTRKPSYDQIERRNEDLKHFAYAVSHDLQEPLRMVTSYAQLLARDYKGKLGKEADQYIDYAVEGAHRMQALLKGMREYWQASESGEDRQATVDCNEVLKNALDNLHETVANSGAVVTHDSLPTLRTDQVLLEQIFQNLVSNAIKYKGKKPPEVHVSAEKNSNGEWVFSAKDNGIGIDAKYADKIFTMFNRLHGRKYPGAGIGLAICKRAIERLGGRIWVESKPGRGADFKFTLPVTE